MISLKRKKAKMLSLTMINAMIKLLLILRSPQLFERGLKGRVPSEMGKNESTKAKSAMN